MVDEDDDNDAFNADDHGDDQDQIDEHLEDLARDEEDEHHPGTEIT